MWLDSSAMSPNTISAFRFFPSWPTRSLNSSRKSKKWSPRRPKSWWRWPMFTILKKKRRGRRERLLWLARNRTFRSFMKRGAQNWAKACDFWLSRRSFWSTRTIRVTASRMRYLEIPASKSLLKRTRRSTLNNLESTTSKCWESSARRPNTWKKAKISSRTSSTNTTPFTSNSETARLARIPLLRYRTETMSVIYGSPQEI